MGGRKTCVVCSQPYRVSPDYKPGYYSSWYEVTWPYRKTVRWSVELFGANAGYAICGCCMAGGGGRIEPYQTRVAPTQAQRLVYPDRCFWNAEGAHWNFRNWGTWSGSRPREESRWSSCR